MALSVTAIVVIVVLFASLTSILVVLSIYYAVKKIIHKYKSKSDLKRIKARIRNTESRSDRRRSKPKLKVKQKANPSVLEAARKTEDKKLDIRVMLQDNVKYRASDEIIASAKENKNLENMMRRSVTRLNIEGEGEEELEYVEAPEENEPGPKKTTSTRSLPK